MCLGSRCVLCDFSNTLGLAKAKTHFVKFFFPFVFKPVCIKRNVVHLILIRFRLTQQKVVSEELENVQAANPASFMEVLLESLSLNPADCLTFSKQAEHFHSLCHCTCSLK